MRGGAITAVMQCADGKKATELSIIHTDVFVPFPFSIEQTTDIDKIDKAK